MFNNKKDTLLGPVEKVIKENALRRQAEAVVNKEFGVYSARGLAAERVGEYQTRLAELSEKTLKNGAVPLVEEKSIDEGMGDMNKSYFKKAKEGNFKVGDKIKNNNSASKVVPEKEFKKKKELEEDKSAQEVTVTDVVDGDFTTNETKFKMRDKGEKFGQGKTPVGSTAVKEPFNEDNLQELSKTTLRSYAKKAVDSIQQSNIKREANPGDNKNWNSNTKKITNRKTGHDKAIEKLEEMSKGKLKSYIKAAGSASHENSASNLASRGAYKLGTTNGEDFEAGIDDDKKSAKRSKYIAKAVDKLEEDNLQELSKGTLKSYIKGARDDIGKKGEDMGYSLAKADQSKSRKGAIPHWNSVYKTQGSANKRVSGINKALDKLEEDNLQEISKDLKKSYLRGAKQDLGAVEKFVGPHTEKNKGLLDFISNNHKVGIARASK